MRQLIISIFLLGSIPAYCQAADDTKKDTAVDFMSMSRAATDCDVVSVRVLIDRGTPVNWTENQSKTDAGYLAGQISPPLWTASERGCLNVVELLLQKGASPNWDSGEGDTALHEAIINKHVQVVKALLDAGADPTIEYESRLSCLELARQSGDKGIFDLINAALAHVKHEN